jgi:hypothetical protein
MNFILSDIAYIAWFFCMMDDAITELYEQICIKSRCYILCYVYIFLYEVDLP